MLTVSLRVLEPTPGEGGAGDGQVLQRLLQTGQDLIAPQLGLDEVGVGLDVLQQRLLPPRHAEEVRCLSLLLQLGAGGRVLVVCLLRLRLGHKRLFTNVVPASVQFEGIEKKRRAGVRGVYYNESTTWKIMENHQLQSSRLLVCAQIDVPGFGGALQQPVARSARQLEAGYGASYLACSGMVVRTKKSLEMASRWLSALKASAYRVHSSRGCELSVMLAPHTKSHNGIGNRK